SLRQFDVDGKNRERQRQSLPHSLPHPLRQIKSNTLNMLRPKPAYTRGPILISVTLHFKKQ
ncbi:hypothetical protein ACN6U4_003928, partial [Cronobacter sakazakii]